MRTFTYTYSTNNIIDRGQSSIYRALLVRISSYDLSVVGKRQTLQAGFRMKLRFAATDRLPTGSPFADFELLVPFLLVFVRSSVYNRLSVCGSISYDSSNAGI